MEPVWLKTYPDDIPKTYEYPRIPLYQLLADAVRDRPSKPATTFVVPGMGPIKLITKTLTYAEIGRQVDVLAGVIHRMGIVKGDRVGIVLPNSPQFVIAYYAAQRLGAVAVPNNPLYTERELEHQLRDSGCRVVITLDMFFPKVETAQRAGVPVEQVIVTSVSDALPFPASVLAPLKAAREKTLVRVKERPGVRLWRNVMRSGDPPPRMPQIDVDNDLAALVYTGGTTGVSKGVMLTHRNLVANCYQLRLWFPQAEAGKERMMSILPFFHCFGQTVCMNFTIALGGNLILMPRFELHAVLDALERVKPTLFPGVPTMYVAINNAAGVAQRDLSSVKACFSGAAPLPIEVAEKFESLTGGSLIEGYGLTETSPFTHANIVAGRRKAGSIGLPCPDTLCKLVDLETGREVPAGQEGELAIKGPQVMKGYWNRPEETADVLRDGWLHTGDVARVDEEGFFYIVDRKKEMIISGGFNVYPREVEEVLYAHPKVLEAAVIGVTDRYRGEAVRAYVVLRPGQTATSQEIVAYCKENLGGYKVPREVLFREALPKSVIGKVLRRVLAEEAKQEKAASA